MEKVLRKNNRGQLVYNTELNKYRLEFGSLLVVLSSKEFSQLLALVRRIAFESHIEDYYRVSLPIDNTEVSLRLSTDELVGLKHLMGLEVNKRQLRLKINFSIN